MKHLVTVLLFLSIAAISVAGDYVGELSGTGKIKRTDLRYVQDAALESAQPGFELVILSSIDADSEGPYTFNETGTQGALRVGTLVEHTANTRTRARTRGLYVAAELAAAREWRVALVTAGKATTGVDNKISNLEGRLASLAARLP